MSGGAESVKTIKLPNGEHAVLDLYTESHGKNGPYFYFSGYVMSKRGGDITQGLFTTQDYFEEDGDEPNDLMRENIDRFDERVAEIVVRQHARKGTRGVRKHTRSYMKRRPGIGHGPRST